MFGTKSISEWGPADVVEFMLSAQYHLAIKFNDFDYNFSKINDMTFSDVIKGSEEAFKQFSAKHWKKLHKYYLEYKACEELKTGQETKYMNKSVKEWEYADVVAFMLAAGKNTSINCGHLDFDFQKIANITGTKLLDMDVDGFCLFSSNFGEKLYHYFLSYKSKEKEQECAAMNGSKLTGTRITDKIDTNIKLDKNELILESVDRAVSGESKSDKSDSKDVKSDEKISRKVNSEDNKTRKADNTPQNADKTPQKADNTPKKADHTPKKSDSSPQKADHTPKMSDSSPKKVDHTLKKSDSSPKKTDNTPKMSDSSPKQADHTPQKSESDAENIRENTVGCIKEGKGVGVVKGNEGDTDKAIQAESPRKSTRFANKTKNSGEQKPTRMTTRSKTRGGSEKADKIVNDKGGNESEKCEGWSEDQNLESEGGEKGENFENEGRDESKISESRVGKENEKLGSEGEKEIEKLESQGGKEKLWKEREKLESEEGKGNEKLANEEGKESKNFGNKGGKLESEGGSGKCNQKFKSVEGSENKVDLDVDMSVKNEGSDHSERKDEICLNKSKAGDQSDSISEEMNEIDSSVDKESEEMNEIDSSVDKDKSEVFKSVEDIKSESVSEVKLEMIESEVDSVCGEFGSEDDYKKLLDSDEEEKSEIDSVYTSASDSANIILFESQHRGTGTHIPVLIGRRDGNRGITVTHHHSSNRTTLDSGSSDQKRKLELDEDDDDPTPPSSPKRRRPWQCESEENRLTRTPSLELQTDKDDSNVMDLLLEELEEVSDDDMGLDNCQSTPESTTSSADLVAARPHSSNNNDNNNNNSGEEDTGMNEGFIITDEVSSDEFENDFEMDDDKGSIKSDKTQDLTNADSKSSNTQDSTQDMSSTKATASENEAQVVSPLSTSYTAVVTSQNLVKVFYRVGELNEFFARLPISRWPVQILVYAAVREQKVEPISGSYLNNLMPFDMWEEVKIGQYEFTLNQDNVDHEILGSYSINSEYEKSFVEDSTDKRETTPEDKTQNKDDKTVNQTNRNTTKQNQRNDSESETEVGGESSTIPVENGMNDTAERLEPIDEMLEDLDEVSDDDDLSLEQQPSTPSKTSQVSDDFCDLDELGGGFIITDEVSDDEMEDPPMETERVSSASSIAGSDTQILADDDESLGSVGEDFILTELDGGSSNPQQKVALFGHSYLFHNFKDNSQSSFDIKSFISKDVCVATIKNSLLWQELISFCPELTLLSLGVNDITANSNLVELASSIENIAKEIEEKTRGYCIIMGLDSSYHPEGMSLPVGLYKKLRNGLNKRLSSELTFARSRYKILKEDTNKDALLQQLIKIVQNYFETCSKNL